MPTLVPDQIITGTNVQQRMMVNFLVVLLDVKLAKNKEKGKNSEFTTFNFCLIVALRNFEVYSILYITSIVYMCCYGLCNRAT